MNRIQNWVNFGDSSVQTDMEAHSRTTQVNSPSVNSEVEVPYDMESAGLYVSSKLSNASANPEPRNTSPNVINNEILFKSPSRSQGYEQQNHVGAELNKQVFPKSTYTTPEPEISKNISNGVISSAGSTFQVPEAYTCEIAQKSIGAFKSISDKALREAQQRNTMDSNTRLCQTWATIPLALKGICMRHYTRTCERYQCRYHHRIHDEMKKKIFNLDLDELMSTYKWTMNFKNLFGEIFPLFVRRLARLNDTATLINLVNDIMQLDLLDRTPFILEIVRALQNVTFNFNETIQSLIATYGYDNPCFMDILLNLTVKSGNLEENWISVRKIIEHRTEEIDHGVISDILKDSLKLNSINLCKNICVDIFEKHIVKFECIDKQIITDFLTQLLSFKIYDYCYKLRHKSGVYPDVTDVPYSPTAPYRVVPLKHMSPGVSELPSVLPREQLDSVDTDLTKTELLELSQSLKPDNMHKFVNLLQNYKCSCKVDAFAANTVVCLRQMDHFDNSYWQMLKYVGELIILK